MYKREREREKDSARWIIKNNWERNSDDATGELTYFAHAHSILRNTNIKGADREYYCTYCGASLCGILIREYSIVFGWFLHSNPD